MWVQNMAYICNMNSEDMVFIWYFQCHLQSNLSVEKQRIEYSFGDGKLFGRNFKATYYNFLLFEARFLGFRVSLL